MKVPLLDLAAQHQPIAAEVKAALERVVDSQAFILGDEVRLLEEEVAARLGAPHAVGVASGSDALLLALMAAGVGPGDEVITTPFTFFATAGAIVRLGARPVFVDLEAGSFNLDPEAAVAALGPRSRALLPVHLFGRCVRMEPLLAAAARRGVAVVEDAAQAIDARRGPNAAGTLGDFGCLSFFPSKNLGAFGDGGMVLVRDSANAERIRRLRTHGGLKMYRHEEVGLNSRLDALQAAVLRTKLPHLSRWTRARREVAERYRILFAGLVPPELVQVPADDPEGLHVWHQFTVRCRRRDALRDALARAGIGCAVYYPVPLHLQPCFAGLGHREGEFPRAEAAAREVLSLPVSPTLSEAEQRFVVERIGAFYRDGE